MSGIEDMRAAFASHYADDPEKLAIINGADFSHMGAESTPQDELALSMREVHDAYVRAGYTDAQAVQFELVHLVHFLNLAS